MKKRLEWLDCLKGFGAILVILGHLNPAAPIERYIYSFHMPLFFFISGLLKKQRVQPLRLFAETKAKSLLVPLVMWDIASSLFLMMIGYDIEEMLNGFFFITKELPMNTPLWFLLSLFICEVVYEVLLSHEIPNLVIVVTSTIIFPFVCEETIIPFTLYTLPLSILFFGLGVIMRPQMLRGKLTLTEKLSIPLLLTVSVLFGGILNRRISMARGYYGNMFYFLIAAVCGILLWTMIFRTLPVNRMLMKIGQHSLFLMSWQYLLFIVANKISIKIFAYKVWSTVSTLKAIIATIVTLMLSLTILWIVDLLRKKYIWIEQVASWFGIQKL